MSFYEFWSKSATTACANCAKQKNRIENVEYRTWERRKVSFDKKISLVENEGESKHRKYVTRNT